MTEAIGANRAARRIDHVHPATVRAHPQRTVTGFHHRRDDVMGETVPLAVGGEQVPFQSQQTVLIGAEPDGAIASVAHSAYPVADRAVAQGIASLLSAAVRVEIDHAAQVGAEPVSARAILLDHHLGTESIEQIEVTLPQACHAAEAVAKPQRPTVIFE